MLKLSTLGLSRCNIDVHPSRFMLSTEKILGIGNFSCLRVWG
jgi:hypothetical protein